MTAARAASQASTVRAASTAGAASTASPTSAASAVPSRAPAEAGPASAPDRGGAGRGKAWPAGRRGWWRRYRALGAAGLVVLVVVSATALLAPRPPAVGYLDPDGTGAYGSHAVADLLAQRGASVLRVLTASAAAAAGRPAGTTTVITSPEYLSRRQLAAVAAPAARVVLVEPTAASLGAVAPRVRLADPVLPAVTVRPACTLPAATAAGVAAAGNIGLTLAAGTPGYACYRYAGASSLVQYANGHQTITVLGSGALLANGQLARQGNAALALNLLGTGRIVWLVPSPAAGGTGGRGTSFFSLVPLGAWLVAVQLGLALLLAAAWRARRLGPLIPERLPVVVRAAETVEGHGRLYAARRARGQAAGALRSAMASRVLPALGLAPGAAPQAVIGALAARSALPPDRITGMMYGQPPASDAALAALAADLDSLEREVLAP